MYNIYPWRGVMKKPFNPSRFIYMGRTTCLETMADSLLAAADKYALDRLKVRFYPILTFSIEI